MCCCLMLKRGVLKLAVITYLLIAKTHAIVILSAAKDLNSRLSEVPMGQ